MSLSSLAVALMLSQADAAATPAAAPQSDSDKALAAATRAAEAAEKASKAVERMADAIAGPKLDVAAPSATGWVGSVGFGLSFITGNTQTLTTTGSVSIDKKWTDWALGIRLSGAYGLANPTASVMGSTSAVTARRAAGTVRGDRSFGSGFASIFVLAGAEFDHVKNLEFRGIGEAGAGLTFFNRKQDDWEKLFLRLDLAMRGGYETRYQYFPVLSPLANTEYGIAILAPRIAVAFRWGFSKDVKFSEEAEFIPFVLAPDAGRLLLNSTTKINARLTEALSVSLGVLLQFDSKPPGPAQGQPGARLPLDAAITVGLEAAF